MSETIEQARAAIQAARQAMKVAEAGRAAAVSAVRDEWQPAIFAAERAEREAVAALAAAESAAAPDHEWTGKRVFRVEDIMGRGGRPQKVGEKRYEGVVEVYRPGAALGRGHYCYTIGTPIVRLLKKDGTPGAKTENLERSFNDQWQLVDPA
jgi:hypothetical protein